MQFYQPGHSTRSLPVAKPALNRYTQYDFIDKVTAHGIPYHEKTLGQLFCDTSAKDIITMPLVETHDAGGELRLQTDVQAVEKGSTFHLTLPTGKITSDALMIATGGKSIPEMGATGWGYQIAAQFDLPLIETRPALVP